MRRVALVILAVTAAAPVLGWEFRGEAALEGRHYPHESSVVSWQSNLSASLKVDVLHEWNEGTDFFAFSPFFRLDQHDTERSHADIRELSWIHVGAYWETRIGIQQVFWGVTEGRHLVDIINQTDYVDQVDEDEKLGQPMINFSTVRDWGTLDLYLLPGFRDRTFAGRDGRPRTPIPIAEDRARYESGAEWHRVDAAVRFQRDWGKWQTALSHFSGTSREPVFQVEIDPAAAAQLALTGQLPPGYSPQLIPVYHVIDQTGLELQYLHGAWLLKAEAISRSGQGKRFQAVDIGFEYTQTGVLNSRIDIGWIVEYLWDNRSALYASPYEHDWLFGARVAFNDFASTELLMGVLIDPHTEERVLTLESSRRIGANFTLSLDAQFFLNTGPAPTAEEILLSSALGRRLLKPLSPYATEDLVQIVLTYYF